MATDSEICGAILELAVEDWYGLWEVEVAAGRVSGETDTLKLRENVRKVIAGMMRRGLLDASIWSESDPLPLSADEMAELLLDSGLWLAPVQTDSREQVRVAATDKGRDRYFRK